MLRVYTDLPVVIEGKPIALFPLLSDCFEECAYSNNEYFLITPDIGKCDYVIIPQSLNFYIDNELLHIAHDIARRGREAGKQVLTVSYGDLQMRSIVKEVIHFQLAVDKSSENQFSVPIPSWIADPYDHLNFAFAPLPFTEQPSIGFCGHASTSLRGSVTMLKNRLAFFTRGSAKYWRAGNWFASPSSRAMVLRHFEGVANIDCNFILRDQYRAGLKGTQNTKLAHTSSAEFYQNIANNQYTVCIRGGGNFSVRFFETLAMGRIPIFIDIDSTFPLKAELLKRNYIPVLDIKDKDQWESQLEDFHSHWKNDFERLQYELRQFWQKHLQKHTFFDAWHHQINKLPIA